MSNVNFRRLLRRSILAVFIWFLLPLAQATQFDWTGEWDSTWHHRGARVSLVQTGDHIKGSYKLYGGTVEGTADGREFRGVWKEAGREGNFVAIMSADERTFTARFGSGDWMTGIRVVDDNEFLGHQVDRSVPAMTLYHFLSIMNAVGPGRMELQSEASQFIDFAQTPVSELDYTQTLFAVLDRLTFRVWTAHPQPDDSEVSVTLGQAGTDVSFNLHFVKRGDEWFISPPPMQVLKSALHALETARPQRVDAGLQGLQSPRDTLRTLIHSFSDAGGALEAAMATLDMSELSALAKEYEAPKLARYINRSLQRIGSLTWQEVPDDPDRSTDYVHFEHPMGSIALGRVVTDEGVIWQFTPETLQTIRAVYAALDNFPANEIFYSQRQTESLYFQVRGVVSNISMGFVRQLGPMELWQWLGLLLVLGGAYALGRVVNAIFYALVLRRFVPASEQQGLVRWLFLWSFRFLVVGVALRVADRVLSFPDLVQVVVVAVSWTCTILSSMMLILLGVGVVVGHIKETNAIHSNHMTPVSFVAGIVRVVVVVFAILLLADVLQVPYQSVLAGLGLGGLAVALAAQSTLQNFISGITLYFDKPIAVGDYCKFGDKSGTVEFIGMRSTRIRTAARTLLTVPNSEFSNLQIENYAQRDRMLLNPTLKLRYETSPDQLRKLLEEFRQLLIDHPKVADDPLRVRFAGFGAHSLDVDVLAYIMSDNESEFVAIREDIYLRIMEVVERAGARLAVPSVVNYNTADTLPG